MAPQTPNYSECIQKNSAFVAENRTQRKRTRGGTTWAEGPYFQRILVLAQDLIIC